MTRPIGINRLPDKSDGEHNDAYPSGAAVHHHQMNHKILGTHHLNILPSLKTRFLFLQISLQKFQRSKAYLITTTNWQYHQLRNLNMRRLLQCK